ncbi:MAG: hypothetical protein AAF456_22350 [Planctomycetota bacterium]
MTDKPMQDQDKSAEQKVIERLDRKVTFLTVVSILQTAALAFLVFVQLIPDTTTLILLAVSLVAFVAIFHKRIPGWIAALFRYAVGRPKSDSARPDSIPAIDPAKAAPARSVEATTPAHDSQLEQAVSGD